jgi:phosphohistidine swiveling domain-containing protein
MLAEEIPDGDIFFFQVPMSTFASDTSYPFIKNYKRVATHYKKFHMDFYFGESDCFEVGESILQALFKKPRLGKEINKNIVIWSNKLIAYAKQTASLNLKSFSNKGLWEIYLKQDQIHTKLYTYGWLPVALDMFHNHFTKKLKSYLYSVCENKSEAENAFIILTTPTEKTIIAKEREKFLAIYKKYFKEIKQNKLTAQLHKELLNHSKSWGHLGYIYAGNVKPFSVPHYFKELRDLSMTGVTADKILKREHSQLKTAGIKQKSIIKKLKISKFYQTQFETGRDFAITKLYRRHAQLLHLYLMHTTLLTEIAKRLKLTRYQVQFMLINEIKQALLTNKNYKKLLITRFKECVLYTEKDFETVYVGKIAKKITKTFKKFVNTDIKEITGQTAQPGFAKGLVKKIFRAKDMGKMNKGDILVSVATDPDIVPAMKKARAIVTEQGGITSHAAIVSRELGIPCVIGTKIATKVLKDGDLVEVDATKGIVKKLN